MTSAKIAVHKFASCDGCQLAFLNAGEALLQLARIADIVHFAEAGPVAPDAEVDIAFVEGSISGADDIPRIQAIRARSRYLVTIGACATAGGLQALRNGVAEQAGWLAQIYPSPQYISSLPESTPIAAHVKVDLELWGCPVTSAQVMAAVRDLLMGIAPVNPADSVCMECKRRGNPCVLVTRAEPCMGPVTRTGCGALCPSFGRACYACYGPAELPNSTAFSRRLIGLGLPPRAVAQRFLFINNAALPFHQAGLAALDKGHD